MRFPEKKTVYHDVLFVSSNVLLLFLNNIVDTWRTKKQMLVARTIDMSSYYSDIFITNRLFSILSQKSWVFLFEYQLFPYNEVLKNKIGTYIPVKTFLKSWIGVRTQWSMTERTKRNYIMPSGAFRVKENRHAPDIKE